MKRISVVFILILIGLACVACFKPEPDPETYSVTYNGNGATGGTAPAEQIKTEGLDLVLASNSGSLVRSGYTFGGWNTAGDGSGTSYAEGATYSANTPLSLYAKWIALATYTISYNSNGSTGGTLPTAQTKTHGVALTLAANGGNLVKAGWSFAGWNTTAEGDGTSYLVGASYAVDASVILYAHWNQGTSSVTYNGNLNSGGTAPEAQVKTQGINLTLATNSGNLSKTGYTFVGWNTQADGLGTDYAEGAVYAIDAPLALYAKWQILTYTISYDLNGGSGSANPTSQIKTYGIDIVLATQGTMAQTGYNFVGWNTQADGNGTNYPAGVNYTANAALALYAKWQIITYPITYDANGGTGSANPVLQTKTYGIDLPLASRGMMTRTGYNFTGWNTLAGGGGTGYTEGATYNINAPLVLYAQWQIISYAVTYNAGLADAGSPPAAHTKFFDQALTLRTNTGGLGRTGYNFVGWDTAADGSGTDYSAGGPYTENAALNLYPRWQIITYTIYYYGNSNTGGSVPSPNPQIKAYNVGITLHTNSGGLVRSGYEFRGWATASNYPTTGTHYSATSPITYTTNAPLSLYAVWKFGSGGSCPFVYVNDGTGKYSYLTDLQGPIIGMPEGNLMRSRAGLYTHEYAVLDGQKVDKEGKYRLKLREIQPEISYIDDIKLLAVDLPEGYDIAVSSAEQTYGNGIVNPLKIYTLKDPRAPAKAVDWKGRDVLKDLSTADGTPAPVEASDVPSYELDFGKIDAANAKLVIYAWTLFEPEFQSPGFIPPTIEVKNEKGEWTKIRTLGLPAGDVKKMVIDLSGKFLSSDTRIKFNLGTRSWVRWVVDAVKLDDSKPVDIATRLLEPESAQLIERGGGTLTKQTFSTRLNGFDDVQPLSPLDRGVGAFTRYGEVDGLLAKTDDMFVIFTNGDELALSFKDPPPPLPGQKRLTVLKIHHYFKPFYDNPKVEPLPFRGMSAYPYPEGEMYPNSPEHQDYLKNYNTRILE